jgi:hypothetical protein
MSAAYSSGVSAAASLPGIRLAEELVLAAWWIPLDRRRISLQIRAILVPFVAEQRRLESDAMEPVRSRARELLEGLEEAVQPYPDLQDELAEARRQVEAGEPLPRRGLGEESVDGGDESVDVERLR